jgi:hypothetical protein
MCKVYSFVPTQDWTRQFRTTMSKTIEEIVAPKAEARPRIYAYSIDAREGAWP